MVLASMVAEINRVFQIYLDAALCRLPPILSLKVVLGSPLTKPKFYIKFCVASFDGCRNK